MPPESINMLTSLQTAEVSLVKRGANNKRIALTKAEDTMDFQELLKTVLATEAEGEDKLIETLKAAKADEDTVSAAIANFRLQNGFKDKLSKDVFGEVAKAAGYEIAKAKEEDEDEDKPFPGAKPFKGKKKKEEEEDMNRKKKAEKSHEPAEMPEKMAAVFKAQQDELAEVKKQLETERRERVRKEFVAKCADNYSHVPGMNSDEMGEMLQKAYEVGDDFGKQLEKQWADTSEAIEKSALISHQGALGSVNDGAGAFAKMKTIAKEMVQKDENLSEAKAMDKVMQENPELYQEYLDENPAQVGRR